MRASNGETTLDSFKEVGQQFLESLTLGGAARNGRNLGPVPAFFSFMHYNFDLHGTFDFRLVACGFLCILPESRRAKPKYLR